MLWFRSDTSCLKLKRSEGLTFILMLKCKNLHFRDKTEIFLTGLFYNYHLCLVDNRLHWVGPVFVRPCWTFIFITRGQLSHCSGVVLIIILSPGCQWHETPYPPWKLLRVTHWTVRLLAVLRCAVRFNHANVSYAILIIICGLSYYPGENTVHAKHSLLLQKLKLCLGNLLLLGSFSYLYFYL